MGCDRPFVRLPDAGRVTISAMSGHVPGAIVPGAIIGGKYKIERQIARGGQGTVF
jgi:hypothetical protein